MIEPGDDVPIIDLASLATVHQVKQRGQSHQSRQSHQSEQMTTEANRRHRDVGCVADCVKKSLPTDTGQRERRLFDLARRLHAVVGADLTPFELVPIFDRWWIHAEPIVATKDYALSLACLVRAYANVRTPYGQTMDAVFDAAKKSKPPRWSIPIRCELLASICRELQRVNGDDPFYLSARQAGALTDEPHPTAWRKMELLVALGYIDVADRGTPGGRKATRYRYIGDGTD